MKCTMQDYLTLVAPYLDSDLVSPEVLDYIKPLAEILPPSSIAGFECRLGANQSRVDFQSYLPLEQSLPELYLTHPTWKLIQNLYRECTAPNSLLKSVVEGIGLEFDIAEQPHNLPIPCVFFALKPSLSNDREKLIKTASSLLNRPISKVLERYLQRCMDNLPDGAYISHFGAMLSRSNAEIIRVVVKGLHSTQFMNYLKNVGWTDSTQTFSDLVPHLSGFVDHALLSFDVGQKVYPRIGWEGFLRQQPYDRPQWQIFLDYLVDQELCTPAKRNALLIWNGFSEPLSAPERWPSNIGWGDRLLGSRAISLFLRWINHVKIVYQPGHTLEAKAYLGFNHSWVDVNRYKQTHPQAIKQSEVAV